MPADPSAILPQFCALRDAIDGVHSCIQSLEAASCTPPGTSDSTATVAFESAARLASYDALVGDLQAQLEGLLRLRAGMAATRNATLPPISSLPPEILRDIFLDVVRGYVGEGGRHSSIVLSHTCSLWRAIALDHPALWSHINFPRLSLRLAKCLVGRCGDFPLKIIGWDTDGNLVKWNTSYYATTELLERTAELSVLVPDQLAWCFSRANYSDPAPSLNRFSLEYYPNEDLEDYDPRGRIVHRRLFGSDDLPNLCHLSMHGYRFPWESGRYKSLRTLTIVNVPVLAVSEADRDIGWAIRESPLLEYLEIGSWSQYVEEQVLDTNQLRILDPPDVPSITLSSLHTVKLRLHSTIVHWLLSAIEAPSIEILHVDFCDRSDEALPIERLFAARPGLDISTILVSLHKLYIHATLCGDNVAMQLVGYSACDEETLKLDLTEPGHTMSVLAAFFQSIPSHSDLTRLRSVLLCSHDSDLLSAERIIGYDGGKPDAPDWSAVLPHVWQRLPSATSLRLDGVAHFFVPGPQGLTQVVDAFFRIENVKIAGDLYYEHGQRLWEWCLKLPSLQSLDMGTTEITFGGNEQHLQLFANQLLRNGTFSITWPRYKLFHRGAVVPTQSPQI